MLNKKVYLLCAVFSLLMMTKQKALAQISLSPVDTTVCPGNVYTIRGAFASQFDNITQDDVFGTVINIGFPFVYYGETFTKCVISANNFITFDTTLAATIANPYAYSSWVYTSAKNGGELDNVIMFPFQDINMGLNQGVINYQTFGAAPNRRFVVEFCQTPLFSCSNLLVTDQLILYEGSNIIEMHLASKPSCPTWNSGTAVEGLRYNALEDLVPGRDLPNVPWSATNDARRFTPNGTTSYTIDSIPFNPAIIIPNVEAADLVWYEEGNPYPISNDSFVTVTADPNVHYYVATITGPDGCNGTGSYTFSDTSWVHFGTAYDTSYATICLGETYPFFERQLYKSGEYDTLFSSAMGCDSFITLYLTVNPLPDVTIHGFMNLELCDGDSVRVALENPEAGSTYQWTRDGAPLAGETYPEIMLRDAGNYRINATTDKGCTAVSDNITLNVHPNPTAGIEPFENEIICAYDTAQITAVSGPNYDYRWTPEKPFRVVSGPEGRVVRGVFTEPTLVVLTVNNEFGCRDSASVMINTKPCCEVFVPSAFSPNGDGNNDFFKPVLQLGQNLTWMKVFNRSGQLVYDNKNPEKGWDGYFDNGQPAPLDTYMYYIEYTCSDGKIYHKKEALTLVR